MRDDAVSLLERAEAGSALTDAQAARLLAPPAEQQPEWVGHACLPLVRRVLGTLPPLVGWEEVHTLRALLAVVAEGGLQVVQAGDCAEDPAECTPGHLSGKIALLDEIADVMERHAGKPVIRVGRIAGQFSKPRSQPFETVNGVTLPVYRGHLINAPGPDIECRTPNPYRMLACYTAAKQAMRVLRGEDRDSVVRYAAAPVWTSHEALVLDFEVPLIRCLPGGDRLLASTHWPWIGERTRQRDGAHVRMLSSVVNPVACKVGPSSTPDDVVGLSRLLDPDRVPGRLTFISRMGADTVRERLPRLVEAVRRAGHPVIWLCDPMHGNTVSGPGGVKTRLVTTVRREVSGFLEAVRDGGGVAGGLHLEVTPQDVAECVAREAELGARPLVSTSLCDPRLNRRQALEVAAAWSPRG